MELNLKIKKRHLHSFFFIILYKAFLDLSYFFVISKVWAYSRFILDFNILKLFESYFLLSVIFFLMPKSREKLSNIMIWLLILISYVPMFTLFAFMNQPRIYMYAVSGFWMLVFLLLKFPTVSFAPLKKFQSRIILYSIFIGLTGIVFFLVYRYLGIFLNFDLTKVYEIRAQYRAIGVPLAGYLFNWLAYIVNPIFFALFLVKRKWIRVGVIIFLQILLFSVTGLKAFLFALLFILVLMWVATRKYPFCWMAAGLSMIILLGMFFYWLIGEVWISSLFNRRALLAPAQLSFFYYDFFSQNEFTFLSQHRIFQNFSNYSYHLDPPHLIAEAYFGKPEMNPNNGIYADAYMNFGFIGFLFWGVLLSAILRLIDSLSKNKDMKIAIAAIAMPAIFLINSPFLTCFLTHGLLLALILLYLLPKRK